MHKELLNKLKSALEKDKKSLTEELNTFAVPDKKVKNDWDAKYENMGDAWDENAQEVTEYATRLPLEHELETRLQQVEYALKKIYDGTYGICDKCAQAIDVERLKANPSAVTCTQHTN